MYPAAETHRPTGDRRRGMSEMCAEGTWRTVRPASEAPSPRPSANPDAVGVDLRPIMPVSSSFRGEDRGVERESEQRPSPKIG